MLQESTLTSIGFFWKSGWAFILGYTISAMIQTFVPRKQLLDRMGTVSTKSLSLTTVFGSISSSCSFAALATARSLVMKGAHFILAIAFMFASTNLVIELGILIWIFLGWQFLAAEILGGLLLIAISSLLIKTFYPDTWFSVARDKVEKNDDNEEDNFDWKKRITSLYGWQMVGHKFVMDWQMVWKEILIGFCVAGFVATLVPESWWTTIFLVDQSQNYPAWLITLENAAIAPFVAALTFIGSMGNIPLATVLNSNGVLFAGIMAFIYSDLMVPPLVMVNAKYYGWRVALYIAFVMYISIVITALILNSFFGLIDWIPETAKKVDQIATFAVDYTFWFNILFIVNAAALVFLNHLHTKHHGHMHHEMEGDGPFKKGFAALAALILFCGLGLNLFT